MKFTGLINGVKRMIITPSNQSPDDKKLIEMFKDGGIYEIKYLEENSSILGETVTGSLLITEIKKEDTK
jgi:hypothetical protein